MDRISTEAGDLGFAITMMAKARPSRAYMYMVDLERWERRDLSESSSRTLMKLELIENGPS